ncbi:hypothetical protein A2V71_00090 [Candidatus Berkelbacteria bacterium RBG_13_40_8]|uniref:Cation-transporting P-type ATPase N-terminal domain-containing protein n=1 Tax=Candidatus Berkelbacteria bacterium RBG_13_40_8 TaxID=1797467 RepID=A0A1F5DM95_9BACT|nr:MAG: hypothetical protein A2V71_00090 [Candidatus Berkelbacteria bacterium RBG_13_40_8]
MEKLWKVPIEEVFSELKSNKEGLSDFEVDKRLLHFGYNSIKAGSSFSFIGHLLKQLGDFLILLLIFASVLSFLLGDSRNGIIIAVIVVFNIIIGFSQEYRAQKILKALNKLLPQMVRVKRGNTEKLVHASSLVPGDIVTLAQGDKVPADIRLIESYDLRVDEKMLTGESKPQIKNASFSSVKELPLTEIKNILYMGTIISSGEALGIVIGTGHNTEFGKIAQKTTQIEKKLSPLQEKTAQMSKRIAILAVFIIIGLVVYKYFVDRDILDAFIFSIAVAAALVPEGLPATIAIALSIGARNLAKKKALARNLVSVETLGSVTIICTDKTGTLTTGQMRVNDVWFEPNLEISNEEKKRLFYEALVLCNDAQIEKNTLGDPMEIALLEWAEKNGYSISQIKKKYEKVKDMPFNSKIRYMSTTFRDGGKTFSYLKGAPEVLMEICHLTEKERQIISKKFSEFAEKGFRVLAVAYNNLFLGLVSIYDPPREEARQAISKCREGHIRIIMITGDNPLTAATIAKMTGITFEHSPQMVLGEAIEKMSDTQLRNVLLGEPIFARALPEHKYRIVDNLIKMGEVVAVTGDGVNDAPALKHSDIGVAMGVSGTDVSREAADMVLLDDNFATIVVAVEEGRAIYDNIKKFLFFILSHNFGELLIILIGMILGLPLPLLAVQILAIDLGTDALPSLALIFEPPEKNVIKTKPRSNEVALLNKEGFFHLVLIGLIIGFGGIWNFSEVLKQAGYVAATTSSLITIVISQITFSFAARCPNTSIFRYPFWKNRYLIYAALFGLILILSIVYLKIFNEWILTSPVGISVWLRAFVAAFVLLIFEEVYKLIKKNYNKSSYEK